MPYRPASTVLQAAAALAATGLLAACGKGEPPPAAANPPAAVAPGAAAAPASAASAPPVNVTTVRAQQRDLPVLISGTGIVAALSTVDVRPQTTSLVTRVHVSEGQFVKAGQLLFTLDARADEANVAKARAQLARDEAALADAQRQFKRSQELLAQNFISQGALDTSLTAVQSQTAAVAADRAALGAAQLGLSYNRVSAPSAGRLGAINVFAGSAVKANDTTLVSLTQLDPIAVAFALPQRHLADALAALKNGGAAVSATLPDANGPAASVSLVGPVPVSGPGTAPGGAASAALSASMPASVSASAAAPARPAAPAPPPPLQGRLKFVDSAVDAASGTVKVKAVFDNAAGKLWPGAYVNIAMTAATLPGAVVVPQAAIVQSARGPLVFAVAGDKVVPRPVVVLYAQGDDAAVSGVKPGERVVLDGRQNVRPGSTVVERGREPGKDAGKAGDKPRAAAAASDAAPARPAP